ncbi:glycosyltransferase family 2 protein [Prevotella sp. TF12-30]|uniref:glycosyltransferase family 2 protein n=1 Tax=Prevotellaceae TaxID=171552 RepID=UPI000E450953|nr:MULTISPECIES: glycosyltransferase family 2 protein [Prevotellaceae]RGK35832.1 glycosyltransferase family 2 protein [Prevotella sp. TF12-30]
MEYKVAVIIPTLNEEKFIARCLDSVIEQSYPFRDMDVMVVDGGSNDRTREIVEEYGRKYINIRFIHNPGRIQSIAFNIGVENSDAPYIVRLDAHALYKPYYIEGCIKGLEGDSKRGNVGGQWDIQPQNDSLWAITNAILNYSKFGIGGASYRIGAKAGDVDTVPFGSFPRTMIEKIGGMRDDLPRGEDNEFNSRIKRAGYSIYFDPAIECIYYARPTLKASCRQMYANGESIGHLFYVDRDSIGLRHMIPLIFVVGIIGGTILSLLFFPFVYLLLAGLCLYFLCDFVASLLAAKEHGWKFLLPLFVMFFCVHFSYGWGTIVGFFTGRKLKNKK